MLGAAGALADAQARADELTKRTEGIRRNPAVQAFLEMPSKRALELQADRLDAQRQAMAGFGVGPRSSTLAGAARLLGGDFSRVGAAGKGPLVLESPQNRAHGWQSLGPFGGRDRTGPPLVASGVAANLRNLNLAGTQGPLLDSGVGVLARAYQPPRAAASPLDPPLILGGLGKLVQGYLGPFRRLEELIADWRRPVEGFLKQAARRTWELYPRDSEGRPIPPWNLRLYFLAWAAYRLDDYGALARFLDEIGADESPDNVLFVRDLLAPTFEPKRPDRRTAWWLLDPSEARRALRKRLESIRSDGGVGHRDGEISYLEDPEDDESPNDPYFYVVKRTPREISAERAFFDHELPALLLEELAAVLPPRQHEVVSLALRGWKQERIAHEMGITVGAVKAHMHKVRNNPGVSEILLPGPALWPSDTQIRGRTHRR